MFGELYICEIVPIPDDINIDGDDPHHIQWINEKAQQRAATYGIHGVDYRLTQGVIKHIIPAVASTNAVIAGSLFPLLVKNMFVFWKKNASLCFFKFLCATYFLGQINVKGN